MNKLNKFEDLPLFKKKERSNREVKPEILPEEIEKAKREKIAESNKLWLSCYTPQEKEEDVLQKFKEEWEKIKNLKEKIGLERAGPALINNMRSLSLAINEAIKDGDLTSLYFNLEDFKDILEKKFGVDLETHGLSRLKNKRK